MGTSLEDHFLQHVQDNIKLACKALKDIGYDTIVVMASKDKNLQLGSDRGMEFIENHFDFIQAFIQYCQDAKVLEPKVSNKKELDDELVLTVRVTDLKSATRAHNSFLSENQKSAKFPATKVANVYNTANSVSQYSIPDFSHNSIAKTVANRKGPDVIFKSGIKSTFTENAGYSSESLNDPDSVSLGNKSTFEGENLGQSAERNNTCISGDEDDDLDDHMKVAANDQEKGFERDDSKEKKKKTMPVRKTPATRKLVRQQNDATKEKHSGDIYKCDQCDKKYRQKKDLTIHQRKHTGEAPYSCVVCLKSFRSSNYLKNHMTSHSTEKQYDCDICGRQFWRQTSVYLHKKTAHSENTATNNILRQKTYNCDQCDKKYRAKKDLTIHRRIHTGDAPYVCPTCFKGFRSSSYLKAHMKAHTGKHYLKGNKFQLIKAKS